jgi:subtilisin family serine protease
MERTLGRQEIGVGLVDGPVALSHPSLQGARVLASGAAVECVRSDSVACRHGTFVAGILFARRDSDALAICPGCSFVISPIFGETAPEELGPATTPLALAEAIVACVGAGARLVNISSGTEGLSPNAERELDDVLDYAAQRQVVVVAAAGNQRSLGSSPMTRHRAVIPVTGTDLTGRPLEASTLGITVGRRGLAAPGEGVPSTISGGGPENWSGTSVAAPIVTGTLALLWSEFPAATAEQIKSAVIGFGRRRTTVVPPLLDARTAYSALAAATC